MTSEEMFERDMALINAARTATMAVPIEEAGKSQTANYTEQAAGQKAPHRTGPAGSSFLNPLAINSHVSRQALTCALPQTKSCLGQRACRRRIKVKGE